ncbi:BREX-2 system adenine-specific DNA-methyltransferase PglX [Nonomuraea spiralis]|uniref:site-specific DNA-methyltransferase (adenine-specific) n=1 Tax=Nonomuraea spiralis TaxID=46182 RepID=A0ABV5IPF6_9ACTN|nr:BREX-2 system adenine-specific DNA-methyltransferase PglX [Nonomuraea spiralis]GGT38515.1 DNA methylase [Nonomuraea spiralis]
MAGVDREALKTDLQRQVKLLIEDLRERSAENEFADRLDTEYQAARRAKRTANGFGVWREDRVIQSAVAWVLATVFVRFCEDNELIDLPFIAGPGERLALATERAEERFRTAPIDADADYLTARSWLIASFDALSASPVAAGLFSKRHNPMWSITPSHDAAKQLLAFWRRTDESGAIVHDFTDLSWNTRFLGDLYQDLSDHAKDAYALLQTPDFVERFILDLTLTPALEAFPLTEEFRLIDPTCGSGHFLLGAFDRLLAGWRKKAEGVNDWELIRRALNSIHGVDKNPFAAAIARFRLLIAAMKAGQIKRLATAPAFPINVAVADSLWHHSHSGRTGTLFDISGEKTGKDRPFTYTEEDIYDYPGVLERGSYHVVVGNPPYIAVRDSAEREAYRKAFKDVCGGKYVLSVPSVALFFELARGRRSGKPGYIGQITSNSFMKREFGDKLIENYLAQKVELTHVIDTSGAYIPGHGTPTVILVGRNQISRIGGMVHAVRSVQGEPNIPDDPSRGHVWKEIEEHVEDARYEGKWITAGLVDRARYFGRHPWVLAAGGLELIEQLDKVSQGRVDSVADSVGITSFTLEDDVYLMSTYTACRRGITPAWRRRMVVGDSVRDWGQLDGEVAIFPYTADFEPIDVEYVKPLLLHMWPYRTVVSNNVLFGGKTKIQGGLKWSEYGRLTSRKLRTPFAITFSEMATHNHFSFGRSGSVFKNSAPVIKLMDGEEADSHLALLGVLNSSVACFWLRQRCFPKGGSGIGRGIQPEAWMERYVFNSSNVEKLPLPIGRPLELARELDGLAQELSVQVPWAVCMNGVPTRKRFDKAKTAAEWIRARMIALQEELDWETYRLYGLISEREAAELRADPATVPDIRFGERAFEFVLASQQDAGEVDTHWFRRHNAEPVREIPAEWPEAYRRVVAKRIEIIRRRRDLALIERPECKRRWHQKSWADREAEAIRGWLLDRCEDSSLWFRNRGGQPDPRVMTVNQLADALRRDVTGQGKDVLSVAELYARDHLGKPDLDVAAVLKMVIADQHVPYLAALRYTEAGLRKHVQWEEVWDKQRKEDRTGERLDIQVPPKYTGTDFTSKAFFDLRGKLDVPKERFTSYPQAGPDGDESLLIGWAGWNHGEQGLALARLLAERVDGDAWGKERVVPLLAGLAEIMPWVWQWHAEKDEWGDSLAEDLSSVLMDYQSRYSLSQDDLKAWRPEKAARKRRAKKE